MNAEAVIGEAVIGEPMVSRLATARARFATVVVIAKEPVPGRVKTRLTPALTPAQAADVAAASLCDTLEAIAGVDAGTYQLSFAGDVTSWLPAGWRHVPQTSGDLAARLAAAFVAAGQHRPGPTVLVGMDTPQLRADQLHAWNPATHDACLGLAPDGGFWAIGLADPALAPAVFDGIPMSSADTGAAQLARLRDLGLDVTLLDVLTDVDTIDTAYEVAAVAPHSRFAVTLADVRRIGA